MSEQGLNEEHRSLCDTLLIGITGCVAATVMPYYVMYLRQSYARHIHVIMTRSARRFVTPYTLRLHSGNWVFTDSFQTRGSIKVPHIELTRNADLFLVMPATANIIGKAAHSVCDDLVSTAIVACPGPVVFVPSMNGVMWNNKGVQQNVERVRELGYYVIEPQRGFEISDLEETYGVMPPLHEVVVQLQRILADRSQ
jgi:phosphopantothenoylcysteine decarboxylase/phosphopantothenate--cysteine ligase